jgi:hypothetical protein
MVGRVAYRAVHRIPHPQDEVIAPDLVETKQPEEHVAHVTVKVAAGHAALDSAVGSMIELAVE